MDLAGKTALVTGGAVRLGRGLCEALAAAGCNVVVHCRDSRAAAAALTAELRQAGVHAWTVAGDLRGEMRCARMVAAARRCAGQLDFLINNAAVFHLGRVADSGEGAWRETLDVNLLAPVFLTRAFARAPAARCVVNVLDRRITGSAPGCLAYLLSKQVLAAFTRTAALDLAPRVRVNAVAPGAVLGRAPDDQRAAREPAGRIPLERRPTAAEVAAAVLYLLGAEAVTGQTIFVDGGQHLQGSGGGSG